MESRRGEMFLAPRDAGRMLGITSGRVAQLANEGRLRVIRDSAGRRLFRPSDVKRLRAERERLADRAKAGETAKQGVR